MLCSLCCLYSRTAFLQLEGPLTRAMMTSTTPDLCQPACCAVLDAFFVHADSLSEAAWASHLTLLDHLLSPSADQHQQTAATAAACRLLLHLPEACSGSGTTEQLLDMLVSLQMRTCERLKYSASHISEEDVAKEQEQDHDGMTAAVIASEFFDTYRQRSAEQLANTCVYIICKAAQAKLVTFDPGCGVSVADRTSRLQTTVSWIVALLQCSDIPSSAIWLAACANLEEAWPGLQPDQVSKMFMH